MILSACETCFTFMYCGSTASGLRYVIAVCNGYKKMNLGNKKARKIISTVIIIIIVLSMVVPVVLSAIMY